MKLFFSILSMVFPITLFAQQGHNLVVKKQSSVIALQEVDSYGWHVKKQQKNHLLKVYDDVSVQESSENKEAQLNEKSNQKASILLYPNPVKTVATLESTIQTPYSIFDVKGTEVQKGNILIGKQSIECKGLNAGTYLLSTPEKTISFVVLP